MNQESVCNEIGNRGHFGFETFRNIENSYKCCHVIGMHRSQPPNVILRFDVKYEKIEKKNKKFIHKFMAT